MNTECKCDSPKAQVQTIFTGLPEYLFIKVGRCQPDMSKIYKKLKFEPEFEIDFPVDLRNSIEGNDQRKVKRHYHLTGIIIHHGQTCDTGHYSSIINLQSNWIYCDDMMVKDIDMNSPNDIEYIQKNCCVLLYKSN